MNGQGTLIGAQTHIKGNLEGDEDLNVVGRVDGTISLTKTLIVEPAGVVIADVKVMKAVVSGTVVGNITAEELVHITEEGRVVGDIAAPRVVLVEGASFRGNVDMGDLEAPRTSAPAARPKPTFAARPAAARGGETARPAPRPAPPPKRVLPAESRAARAARKPEPRAERTAAPEARKAGANRLPSDEERTRQAGGGDGERTVRAGDQKPRAASTAGAAPPQPPTTAGKKTKGRRR